MYPDAHCVYPFMRAVKVLYEHGLQVMCSQCHDGRAVYTSARVPCPLL